MKATPEEIAAARQRVREETWESSALGLDFPDGSVELHVDGEGQQMITDGDLFMVCSERATLASAAPEMYRALKKNEWAATDKWSDARGCPECMGVDPTNDACDMDVAVNKDGGTVGHTVTCTSAAAIRKAEGR